MHKGGHNSSASEQNCVIQTSEQVGYAVSKSVWSSMFRAKQEVKAQKVHAEKQENCFDLHSRWA
jgi:hypothetical protein